jgi:hypothetical protein
MSIRNWHHDHQLKYPETLRIFSQNYYPTPQMKKTRTRIDGIAIRKMETNAFASTGLVLEPWQYGALTNATYQGLLGANANELKQQKGLQPKDNLRDSLDDVSLAAIALSELVSAKKAKAAKTFSELQKLTLVQAQRVGEAIAHLDGG